MAECSECGKQTMSFTCHYCGKKFCSEHRLPENHECQELESGKKEEYMPNSKQEEENDKNSSKSSSEGQKWFKEKNLKQEKKSVRRGKRNSLLSDIKYTLKNNLTLSIITVTSVFYFIAEIFDVVKYGLMLFPNLSAQALSQNPLTEAAATTLGYEPTLIMQPWGIATVMLAHGGLIHLFANMATLYFFGSALEKAIGSRKLLKFYIGAGLVASIAYILFNNLLYLIPYTITNGLGMNPAVGASGAVVAVVGAVAVLYPDAEVLLYFVFPMKISTAVKAFGAIEVINIITRLVGVRLPIIGGFASSAHLAGLVTGILIGKKLRDQRGRRGRINLFQQ